MIAMPWTRSVQASARRPPIDVYSTTNIAAAVIAQSSGTLDAWDTTLPNARTCAAAQITDVGTISRMTKRSTPVE